MRNNASNSSAGEGNGTSGGDGSGGSNSANTSVVTKSAPAPAASTIVTLGTRTTRNSTGNLRSITSVIQDVDRSFEGKTLGIGGILALKTEKVAKNVPSETFRELFVEYLMKELERPRDVIAIVRDMIDPKPIFIKRYTIKDLTADKEKSTTKKAMHTKQINLFVERLDKIDENMDKIFSYIWDQCTSGLQSAIIGMDEYEDKSSECDVIWLLEQLKLVTSGIDKTTDKYGNLIKTIMTLFTMRQGDTESNDGFLRRFKSNVQSFELAGGEHLFHGEKLEGTLTTDKEKKEASERLKRSYL